MEARDGARSQRFNVVERAEHDYSACADSLVQFT
jgi:hypothetical protein